MVLSKKNQMASDREPPLYIFNIVKWYDLILLITLTIQMTITLHESKNENLLK